MDQHTMFISLLRRELVPALGCTEPSAIAYTAALARQLLGTMPQRIEVWCSGNVVKNVKSVTVPNSNGMHGIEAAAVLGVVGGDPALGLEVLRPITDDHREATRALLGTGFCACKYLDSDSQLDVLVYAYADAHSAAVEVKDHHTNVVRLEKDGISHLERPAQTQHSLEEELPWSLNDILDFVTTVDPQQLKPIFQQQIEMNSAIANEGLQKPYGAQIGRFLLQNGAKNAHTLAKAMAAAGSDARMSGCAMPVVINSGSGNQGIASSVPVIVYARENNIPQEKLYRALAFSALLTIHQKEYIGKLSAFCGAVSASCASAAAVTYLAGGTVKQIKDTVDNTLANIPGIICDGAKASCAAKIASSLDAAMMAHFLAMQGKCYSADTGILKQEAEDTISCVGHIGKVGMRETDKEIIKLMLQ